MFEKDYQALNIVKNRWVMWEIFKFMYVIGTTLATSFQIKWRLQ